MGSRVCDDMKSVHLSTLDQYWASGVRVVLQYAPCQHWFGGAMIVMKGVPITQKWCKDCFMCTLDNITPPQTTPPPPACLSLLELKFLLNLNKFHFIEILLCWYCKKSNYSDLSLQSLSLITISFSLNCGFNNFYLFESLPF